MKRETHTIDATDRVLGRLAVQIARLLRGKHKPEFIPRKDVGDFVVVKNASRLKVTGKKAEQKKYYHHSGFMGGLKEIPFEKLFKRDPGQVVKKAVWGMMPKNKLSKIQIKRLSVKK